MRRILTCCQGALASRRQGALASRRLARGRLAPDGARHQTFPCIPQRRDPAEPAGETPALRRACPAIPSPPMDPTTRDLLRHFLAPLAYRTQKALRDAPESVARFQAGHGVRTTQDLVR